MNSVNGYKQWIMTIVTMTAFAFFSVYLPPEMQSWMFLAYMLVFFGIYMAMAGLGTKKILQDIEYVSKGKLLYEADKKEVFKVKAKDSRLTEELKEQTKQSMAQFLPMMIYLSIFIFIIYVPSIRETLITLPYERLKPVIGDDKLSRFAAYLLFYFILMAIQLVPLRLLSGRGTFRGSQLLMPSKYRVTDRGIIMDDRMAIRFPLLLKAIRVNRSRRFVEIKLRNLPGTPTAQTGEVRLRLYTNKVEDLAEILKSRASLEDSLTE